MRLTISLLVPGLPFNGETIKTESLGGSESAGYYLAKALAQRGHRVTMFNNTPQRGTWDGVEYRPVGEWAQYVSACPHDVAIVQRLPEQFARPLLTRLNVLWCHDLTLGRNAGTFKGALWNVDKVAVLSQFMLDQYKRVLGLPDEQFFKTRNGVDLSLFGQNVRDKFKLIYAARPERGVDNLLEHIWPRLLKEEPGLKLHLCSYNNSVPHLDSFYAQVDRLITKYKDSVVWLGNLSKSALARQLETARVYVYPTPSKIMPGFAEISCISLMEAQAAGLPVVTSARGALPETLGPDAGVLIAGDPWSEEYIAEFCAATLRYCRDDAAFEVASAAGRAHAALMDWDGVAAGWEAMFMREIKAHTADVSPDALARHFIRRSDVMAAKALPISAELRAEIDEDYGFIDTDDGVRAQYEKIGATHTDAFQASAQEPRYAYVRDWLRARPELSTVLDYGCAHGGYCVNLRNELGRKWIGVDVDKHSLAWARKNFIERGPNDSSMRFMLADRLPWALFPEGEASAVEADAALMLEVLEHAREPWRIIDHVEACVRPGGQVLISVPYGPWEYDSYRTYPHRCHVWEFDTHDLMDMLGEKKDLSVQAMVQGLSGLTNEPLGHHLISYTVDPARKTGQIDMMRKLSFQRPRQTVSAALIAGPGSEDTLHWCLKSLVDVADEIVVADCGMSDEARRIAQQYGVKLITGSNPKEHGFETPRNEALAACSLEWVLWIDTDEKLLNPAYLNKYLRRNIFNGYSLRQHHFAVDTTFAPDMPVRLFRRPVTGSENAMRFYGCLAGETKISTTHGEVPIQDLVGQKPWVYCYDHQQQRITLAQAQWIGVTRKQQRVLAIELDDGTVMRATPEHPFLRRKTWKNVTAGAYVRADELKSGDRLMPFYRFGDGRKENPDSARSVALRGTGMCRTESRFVYETAHGRIPKGFHVHHKDHDRTNNDPDNLVALSPHEHLSSHKKGLKHSKETRKRLAQNHAPCGGKDNAMFGRKHSVQTRQLIGEKSRARKAGYGASQKGWFTSDRVRQMNQATWADPVVRQKRLVGMKRAKTALAANHRVRAVRDGGIADVYNIEMPAPNHNFAANGVIVHNCIHEHPELGLNNGPGRTVVLGDVSIPHVGYLHETGRRQRFMRNYPLLQKDIEKYPERLLQKHFIMRDHMLLCLYELQQNGGQVTEDIKRRAEETLALYRKYFSGKGHYANVDSLQYYSQAVKILGLGADVAFQLVADKTEAKPNGAMTCRFATKEDLMAELTKRADDVMSPLLNPEW